MKNYQIELREAYQNPTFLLFFFSNRICSTYSISKTWKDKYGAYIFQVSQSKGMYRDTATNLVVAPSVAIRILLEGIV